jgi:hypothetical protein
VAWPAVARRRPFLQRPCPAGTHNLDSISAEQQHMHHKTRAVETIQCQHSARLRVVFVNAIVDGRLPECSAGAWGAGGEGEGSDRRLCCQCTLTAHHPALRMVLSTL